MWYTPKHIVITKNDELQAILPLFLSRTNTLLSPPTGDYGGPCILQSTPINPTLQLIAETALQISKKLHAPIYLKSLPKRYIQKFGTMNFERRPFMTTFQLDLKNHSIEDLMQGWRRDTRRGIKRAQRENIEVEIASNETAITRYYKLYKHTMNRLKASARPYSFFKLLWNHFYGQNILQVLLAKKKNQYIAGLICFIYKGTMHIYGNVSYRELNRYFSANDLLHYEAICKGLQRNCDVIDFGLTPPCQKAGLYQFKKRWGGVPKPLTLVQRTCKKAAIIVRLKQLINRLH